MTTLYSILMIAVLAAEHPGMEILVVDISRDDDAVIKSEIIAWQDAYVKLPAAAKPNEPAALAHKVYNRGDTAIPYLIACLRQAAFDRQSGLTTLRHLPRAAVLWALSGSTIARNMGVRGEDNDAEEAVWMAFWAMNYKKFLVNHQPIPEYWDPFTK
jgi:hypothetical protein